MQIYNEFSDKFKYKKIDIQELRILTKLPIKKRFKAVGIPLYKIPQISLDCLVKYKELIGSLKTFDNILDMLKDLKNNGFHLSIYRML